MNLISVISCKYVLYQQTNEENLINKDRINLKTLIQTIFVWGSGYLFFFKYAEKSLYLYLYNKKMLMQNPGQFSLDLSTKKKLLLSRMISRIFILQNICWQVVRQLVISN